MKGLGMMALGKTKENKKAERELKDIENSSL